MSNTPLLNIIVLQNGHTPIEKVMFGKKQNCVHILQTAMVCYFNIIIEQFISILSVNTLNENELN